jgi:sensor c-di-GMP phosphodiesterase-like protein
LALDDFGKGHSSLARLQKFPISILKVDSSFVREISEGKPQILDAITALASELKLEITAEGIETEEQFEHLRRRGAAMGQGVFFSDALTPEAAERLLGTSQPWMARYRVAPGNEFATGFAAG